MTRRSRSGLWFAKVSNHGAENGVRNVRGMTQLFGVEKMVLESVEYDLDAQDHNSESPLTVHPRASCHAANRALQGCVLPPRSSR